jgi:coatomer subunit epsilon
MDPYSAEGELINIHNAFHQGQYQEVVDFDTSSFSPENALPAKVLALRAQVALGNAQEVLEEVKGEKEPALEAVGALAEASLGKTDSATQTIEKLAAWWGDAGTVEILGGRGLHAAGETEEALGGVTPPPGSGE